MRNTFCYSFYCRNSKKSKKDGLAPVELTFIINGERKIINLPMRFNPTDFNKKRKPKEIEDYLNATRATISKVVTEMQENGIPLTAENLREYFRTGGVKQYTAEDLFNDYLTILRSRVPSTLSQGIYRKYEQVRDMFFEHFNKTNEATQITNADVRKFFAFLDGNYQNSTAVGMKRKFFSFIRFGIDNNRIKISPLQGIKIVSIQKPIDFLTEEQIQTIVNAEMPNESLEKVRAAFVFQLSSGLSFSDLLVLSPSDLKEENGVYFLSKLRKKTGKPFTAYVYKEGVDVWNKYNGHIPTISNQKYNSYLHVLGDIVGIPHLHSHLARHTYCTRLLRANVPIKVISKAAGHVNSTITERYYAHLEDKTVLTTIAAAVR